MQVSVGCERGNGDNIKTNICIFQPLCGDILRTLLGKCQKQMLLKLYRVTAVLAFLNEDECWTVTNKNEKNADGTNVFPQCSRGIQNNRS